MVKKRPPMAFVGRRNLRKRISIEKRRMFVAELYLQGCTIEEMAQYFKVKDGVISKDLKLIRERWQKEAVMNMDERKAKELARLDQVEAECWQAWHRSIETQKVCTRKVRYVRIPVKGKKGVHKKIPAEEVKDVVVRTCAGDPRFLEQIERCVTLRLKMFGLLKNDHTNMNQVFIDWSGLVGGEGTAVNPVEEKIKAIEQQAHVTTNPGLPQPRKDVIEVQATTPTNPNLEKYKK